MLREERGRKVDDVIHPGASYCGVFRQVVRGDGAEITVNPTPVALASLGVFLRDKDDIRSALAISWHESFVVIQSSPTARFRALV